MSHDNLGKIVYVVIIIISRRPICLLTNILYGYIWLKSDGSAIHFDEVIAIYKDMFQFTNFAYKLLSLNPVTRYHQDNFWKASMEI